MAVGHSSHPHPPHGWRLEINLKVKAVLAEDLNMINQDTFADGRQLERLGRDEALGEKKGFGQ